MRLILTILSLICLQAQATVYYVKSSGGTGDGLSAGTAWTFAQYKAVESTLSNNTILLNRGDVFYGTLNPPSNVVYNSYGFGANPIITGFTTLTSWTNVGTNLWEASVSAGTQLNMVTVNGTAVEPGRFPNTGWLPIINGYDSTIVTNTPSPSTYTGGKIVVKKKQWVIDKCPITSISGSTINFTNPRPDPLTGYETQPAVTNCGYFFTEHPLCLDVQNEWYYTSGTLRMYSTVNPSTLNVKAATINTLVNITGGVSNARFATIDFQGSNEDGVFVSGGSGNVIENCGLSFTGRKGIYSVFSQNLTIRNNNISYTNWSAVDAILGSYQYVIGNNINNIAMLRSLCQPNNNANHAIWTQGSHNLTEGNILNTIGYVGIDMGGDYDTCRNNFIDNWCMLSTDGGGIYMGSEPNGIGRLIENNTILHGYGARDGSEYPWNTFDDSYAIYLDESTAGVMVRNNFCALNVGGGASLHMANNVTFDNNTFYGNTHRQVKFQEDNIFKTRMVNIEWTNNKAHSLNGSEQVYVFYAVDKTSKFFSRCANNILSNPGNPNNLIHEIIDYYNVADYTYSLNQWRTQYPNFETFSTGAPASFSSGTPQVQITYSGKYNAPLDGVYQSIDSTIYKAGTIVLQPFSGAVLKRVSDFVPVVTVPRVVRGKIFR